MISQSGKKIVERFVVSAKALLMQNVTQLLQQYYGIWADGHTIPVEQLPHQDTDMIHNSRLLRDRLNHLQAALPETEANKERMAVGQLIAEQAFTQLNRFCALRMCEERELILESIHGGYDAVGFQSYDAIAQKVGLPIFERYKWYLNSLFDELSIELPAVFDRFSPFGLVFPDESTLMRLLEMINDPQLSAWYDEQNGNTVNFWKEDETLGWMFQYYNSLEERRKMREESNKPRNSREMAVRNQFFTPEYVVRFLTDNSLGRIWYEMTQGQSHIGEELCHYLVRREGEVLTQRPIKEPTEILSLDPTCGSMHFGLYLFEVYEYIYMDAWDHQPQLLHTFREVMTRRDFLREVPRLILENNLFGCEIDPRALQIAALSLWLRAQRSYSEMKLAAGERPLIRKSNLVLAEAMPGNKRLLKGLMEELDKPMQRLLSKIWDKMQYVGEIGLLLKMEKEIEDDIDYLRKNWSKVNQTKGIGLFDTEEQRAKKMAENEARQELLKHKETFFDEVTDRLQAALVQLSEKMGEEEGYENALFSEDATRGFAFIDLCQRRFDCIVMNPPFGEGSEHTSNYLDDNYPAWCSNLVCAFFDRMQEMLTDGGLVGAIFDRTIFIKSHYVDFRKKSLCGYIRNCADTGWNVLDANVETSSIVIEKRIIDTDACFIDLRNVVEKEYTLKKIIHSPLINNKENLVYYKNSIEFLTLPNSIIGYYFDNEILIFFKYKSLINRGFEAKGGHKFHVQLFVRLFYEVLDSKIFQPVAGNGKYFQFYAPYRDMVEWKSNGVRVKALNLIRNPEAQKTIGIYYGERGDILDSQILKPNMFTTQGYIGIPVQSTKQGFSCLSFTNSIISQYALNLFSGGHKMTTYVNQIPMPDYATRQSDIKHIVSAIIDIKRKWFSFDETNLEYHGLIAQLGINGSLTESLDKLQNQLSADHARYQELVKENDDLWMDLANIDRDSDFRKTLNDYKSRRPYEELLSIDGASNKNHIDRKVMAQELVQELVGMAFGRWDIRYAQKPETIPPFGDVFDALPFMPVVSLSNTPSDYSVKIPENGILCNQQKSPLNLATRVRDVMHLLWHQKADDLEYELCQLMNVKSLQVYLSQPSGFFDYHFKRYTKSRRKAPIYWPLSSADGTLTYWLYYPRLSKNTLPNLMMALRTEEERLRSQLNATLAANDKTKETAIRGEQEQVEGMKEEVNRVMGLGYVPNHDDGVPVTAAPLVRLIAHTGWRNECQANMDALEKGDYDWSHLSMSLYPARVIQKAKIDWCLALTHGLEHLCENKPKEKKSKRKKTDTDETIVGF